MQKSIQIFYKEDMNNLKVENSFSKSPSKPKIFTKQLIKLDSRFKVNSNWKAFTKEDFYIAHTKKYVNDFFSGKEGKTTSASLEWSQELCTSVMYTNASLYYALLHSITNNKVTISPTSGFHHASPEHGSGFCTFSGQVIASTKIYRDLGLVGCYLDLDMHFGNSIEDSRKFVKDLNKSIPEWANFNPELKNKSYVKELKIYLGFLEQQIIDNKIHYIVWCHGADSHNDDDLGGKVDTERWIECSKVFYRWYKNFNTKLEKTFPLVSCLFGGYRKDDYQSVINLHLADHLEMLNSVTLSKVSYKLYEKKENLKYLIKLDC